MLLVIAVATGRRLEFITASPFWFDEAESSINALTILERGVPVDRYLGLPIYENTLRERWPGNPEYEFKDISYSDRGLAIYHGWLPLYAMAISLKLGGIAPDRANQPAPFRTLNDLKRRTLFARLPSVVFGAVFLLLCYWSGKELFGRDAGWTALAVGALSQGQITLSLNARYYSATVALGTAALLCLWFVFRYGQRKHYIVAALVFACLFYTHLLTFAAAMMLFCAMGVYLAMTRSSSLSNACIFCLLLAALTLPWIFASGFLTGLNAIPPGRKLLSFPRDLLAYPPARSSYLFFLALCFGIMFCARYRRSSIPERVARPFNQALVPGLFLLSWIVCGYLSFLLLIPAASFFPGRMTMNYWGAILLLGTLLWTASNRAALQRFTALSAPLSAIVFLASMGFEMRGVPLRSFYSWAEYQSLNTYLHQKTIAPRTLLFAWPNQHLSLTFYTGLPFQSIVPVRKTFLDNYPGDIIMVDRADFTPVLGHDPKHLSTQSATPESRTLAYRRGINSSVLGLISNRNGATSQPSPENPEPEHPQNALLSTEDVPMLRGFKVTTWHQWWGIFFYRFVDPLSRIGYNANYANRLRGSTADLLTNSNWAIYYLPYRRGRSSEGVTFHILP